MSQVSIKSRRDKSEIPGNGRISTVTDASCGSNQWTQDFLTAETAGGRNPEIEQDRLRWSMIPVTPVQAAFSLRFESTELQILLRAGRESEIQFPPTRSFFQ